MPVMRPLPPLPESMLSLPIDERGYPVPAFVAWVNGKPEFRVADSTFRERALRGPLCWVCGQRFATRHRWYALGPMCVINRNTSEPACHLSCAEFSAKACPFMLRPMAKRRESNLPEGTREIDGFIKRNPGVTALYETRDFKVDRRSAFYGDYLIELGPPQSVLWYTKGRQATKVEVLTSITTGLQALIDAAVPYGISALQQLKKQSTQAVSALPKGTAEEQDEAEGLLFQWAYRIGEAERILLEELHAKA